MTDTPPTLPPVKLAFIIDGQVADVLHTDTRLGAILLSEPTILDVSDKNLITDNIQIGSVYDPKTGLFTPGE